jgi:hypothetical protein
LQQLTTDPNSGHFKVGGLDQAPNTVINLIAAQLADPNYAFFVAGSVAADIVVNAFDGKVSAIPAEFHVI